MSTAADHDVVIPAVLRAARGSYAQGSKASPAAAGFDDLEVIKQAASQPIDTL